MRSWLHHVRRLLSPGTAVVLFLACASGLVVWRMQPSGAVTGLAFWVFAKTHYETYHDFIGEWNRTHAGQRITLTQFDFHALERRMLSGFLAGTPLADVFEVERMMAAKTFVGPLDAVGFLDLTDRLRDEGIAKQINTPSFSPWTSRGRVFGIPHDVHPVLLAYRADLVEAAGIDVSQIETWDDYFRLLRPLQKDLDGDGRPDRWLLNAWYTNAEVAQMLLFQAGGSYFDAQDNPRLNNPENVRVVARLVTWFRGPDRVCTDVDMFSALGHQERINGVVIGSLVPDWMAGLWRREIPGLAGKIKLMPLPAWEPGGCRTSVSGGTMLAINRQSPHTEAAWRFAKQLYFSPQNAEKTYRETLVISAIKSLWSESFYDEPEPFFSGQRVGRMFIEQAPSVPVRPSSPYASFAQQLLVSVLISVSAFADDHAIYDAAALETEARRLLDLAQAQLVREISRNTFLTERTSP